MEEKNGKNGWVAAVFGVFLGLGIDLESCCSNQKRAILGGKNSKMASLTCNSCNSEFEDDAQQKIHYKSEWHRYNLRRKVAGVPGVTEALFQARQKALAEEQKKLSETAMLYSCTLCGKEYRSSKAHTQHLKSRSHAMRVSQRTDSQSLGTTIIKPLRSRNSTSLNTTPVPRVSESEESEDGEEEWEEVDPKEVMADMAAESLMNLNVKDDSDDAELDPSCCFMCDLKHKTIESCMVHMHKMHGFFIPDAEYLKDPTGLLKYLGLKVMRDLKCLYCNDRRSPFNSLEAVRKHIVAKCHCKLHYGDGGDDEEAELEEFYDYSSSYMDEDGKQLSTADDTTNTVELGFGTSELVLTRKTVSGTSYKTLGSREFLRYYRQKPRPTTERDVALTRALVSRYQNMGLATVQSKEQILRMKVLKMVHRSGVEAMRTRVGLKNNVIRNLPKNVPY